MKFQFELYFIDKEIGFLITVPGPKPGRGGLPIMAYTGRLRLKGVPFSGLTGIRKDRISLAEVFERVAGKSVIAVCDGPKGPG